MVKESSAEEGKKKEISRRTCACRLEGGHSGNHYDIREAYIDDQIDRHERWVIISTVGRHRIWECCLSFGLVLESNLAVDDKLNRIILVDAQRAT